MAEMQTVETVVALRELVTRAKRNGKKIAFVPTMGALHKGHMSLVKAAKEKETFVVLSVFVNPLQFGPNEDFHLYPRPIEADLELCKNAGVDLVFNPSVEEMYPNGFASLVEVSGVSNTLCGLNRPGHFKGVTTVVLKLFNQVLPDFAFFGQKDAQQALVIKKMVLDLNLPLEVIVCPTLREEDGLALSSRNRYLTTEERLRAPEIYKALCILRDDMINKKYQQTDKYRDELLQRLAAISDSSIDYAEVVNANSLETLYDIKGLILCAVAVRLGRTRLIDNILISIPA